MLVQLAFGIKVPINRGRFWYVSNICDDNYLHGCSHVVIRELLSVTDPRLSSLAEHCVFTYVFLWEV